MFITVNGVRLEYNDGGDGIPIVTLHGGPGMSNRASDWRTFQPFTDQYRLISYDQRGNGGSEGKEPNIVGWLVKHGYSDEDVAKVIGGNTMRVLEQVWWK